jgi:hypothetical protein
VSGKVSYQGRTVTHGSVTFVSSDRHARSGVILPDGSYTVEDVHPGEVKVAVASRDPNKGTSILRGGKPPNRNKSDRVSEARATGWFPLPRDFEDPEKSGLGCTIGTGTISHDIELR